MVKISHRGAQTKLEILDIAVDIASAEGLEGLTIGRLAKETGMSKSGLFGHFGSKEDLQLAVIDTALDIFVTRIVEPARDTERGITRLRKLLDGWLAYVEGTVFRGGCFFAAAAAEFDGRPGPVRDRIAHLSGQWVSLLEEETRQAQRRGEIDAGLDPGQLVFELHAFAQESNWAHQLMDASDAFDRARIAMADCLRRASTGAQTTPEGPQWI